MPKTTNPPTESPPPIRSEKLATLTAKMKDRARQAESNAQLARQKADRDHVQLVELQSYVQDAEAALNCQAKLEANFDQRFGPEAKAEAIRTAAGSGADHQTAGIHPAALNDLAIIGAAQANRRALLEMQGRLMIENSFQHLEQCAVEHAALIKRYKIVLPRRPASVQ